MVEDINNKVAEKHQCDHDNTPDAFARTIDRTGSWV